VPYVNLTPGTRSGIVHDEHYAAFVDSLGLLEAHLNSVIEDQRRAEEEQANTESLRAIQRAFREAMLVLPREEYDWFEIRSPSAQGAGAGQPPEQAAEAVGEEGVSAAGVAEPVGTSAQRKFKAKAAIAVAPAVPGEPRERVRSAQGHHAEYAHDYATSALSSHSSRGIS
jgi:hypothetical protein